jgi:pimeloyl-ACP methyl ester carboxylesterase
MRKIIFRLSMISYLLFLYVTSCNNNIRKSPQIVKSDKFVDIGTHKLRVILSDIPSEYTIVLEAGGGNYSDAYQGIQDTLAKITGMRVMSYDRSGFGHSEFGPDVWEAKDDVEALKKCLKVLDINDKLILVGHSYGGFLAQYFSDLYPEMLSGIVLLDPMNVKFVDKFGFDKISAATHSIENPTTDGDRAINRLIDFVQISFDSMRGKELPIQIPVSLITVGHTPYGADEIWRTSHLEMLINSEKHKLIIAEENGHDIIKENPELVLNTILELINKIESK